MTTPNKPFTAKVGEKALREKVSIWTLDGLKDADIEIDNAIAKAYEQGKKEHDICCDTCEKSIKYETRHDTLEEVLEDIKVSIKAWKAIGKKEPLADTSKHMLLILYNWQHDYDKKIKEAKGK